MPEITRVVLMSNYLHRFPQGQTVIVNFEFLIMNFYFIPNFLAIALGRACLLTRMSVVL